MDYDFRKLLEKEVKCDTCKNTMFVEFYVKQVSKRRRAVMVQEENSEHAPIKEWWTRDQSGIVIGCPSCYENNKNWFVTVLSEQEEAIILEKYDKITEMKEMNEKIGEMVEKDGWTDEAKKLNHEYIEKIESYNQTYKQKEDLEEESSEVKGALGVFGKVE